MVYQQHHVPSAITLKILKQAFTILQYPNDFSFGVAKNILTAIELKSDYVHPNHCVWLQCEMQMPTKQQPSMASEDIM